MHVFLIMGLSRASTNLPGRSPASRTPSPVFRTPRSDPNTHTRLSYYELPHS